MKKVIKTLSLTFFIATMTVLTGCKKNDVEIPVLRTAPVSVISATEAASGGIVNSDGGREVTARGIFWGTSPYPAIFGIKTTDGTGTGVFSSNITGLTTNMTYYVMAYAINSAGISYGELVSFTTPVVSEILFNPDLNYGSVKDIDGNVYKTIQIGSQEWLAENLKTTKYNDGTPIRDVTDNMEWQNLKSDAYCWYNNDASSFKDTYGALYNWYAVNTGRLCPSGWHVPSSKEWLILSTYLGGGEVAGGKLKEIGTGHWLTPNIGATNSSGFAAVPGGLRDNTGDFEMGYYGINNRNHWWSSDLLKVINPIYDLWPGDEINDEHYIMAGSSTILGNTESNFYIVTGTYFNNGQSVRCVKDN